MLNLKIIFIAIFLFSTFVCGKDVHKHKDNTTLSDNMSSIENPDESQEISVPGTGDEHEQPADRTTDASAEESLETSPGVVHSVNAHGGGNSQAGTGEERGETSQGGTEEADNIDWQPGNWALGCDFPGNDLSRTQISSDQCGGRCAATDQCSHFTWTSFEGGTCWMKRGQVSRGNAVRTSDNSMVCGIVGGLGPGIQGRTTRYWDCCKPSCSWPGKVSGSNAVVKSCQRDGNSAIDVNAQSGCGNGGQAYTCNNQKPWAVNDQLAYGFAAATIPGMGEKERCCACYKLDFNNGPVSGKTMIVQVTNSGDDVGANQFDLQIPGGGVGIFNGCKSQWNAGENGWGQRHGGVSSRSECDALPEQIRGGCYFRFDWFRGADNPTMTYSKVNCPSELVAITGCSR